jgi:hypothetical protein
MRKYFLSASAWEYRCIFGRHHRLKTDRLQCATRALRHVGFDTLDLFAEELIAQRALRPRAESDPARSCAIFLRFVVIVDRRHLCLLPQKSSRRCVVVIAEPA